MWAKVAEELAVPWRAAEAMHWQLGEAEMARRAGVVPFSLAAVNLEGGRRSSPSRSHAHTQSHGTISRDMGVPSPRSMYGRPQPVPGMSGGRALASRRDTISQPIPPPPPPQQQQQPLHPPPPPHQMGPEPVDVYYGPGPGLAPIQNQPPPRNTGLLPSLAELTTGISPYSTLAPGGPPMGATAGQGPYYPNVQGYPNIEPARSKRRASSDAGQQHDTGQRRRMG